MSAAPSKTVTLPLGQIILIQTVLNSRFERLIDLLGYCSDVEVAARFRKEIEGIHSTLHALGAA
jgi:hypothetical protein